MKFLDMFENLLYQAILDEDFIILFLVFLFTPFIAPILWIFRFFGGEI